MPTDDRVAACAAVLRTHAAVLPKLERALQRSGMPLTWYEINLETVLRAG